METKVKDLVRKERVWVCNMCSKEYPTLPTQCVCGATDKSFDEKDGIIEETGRKKYRVTQNIIYEAQQVNKGAVVTLVVKDRVTKNLLTRKLIEEIKEGSK